jgi:hypothetical protein
MDRKSPDATFEEIAAQLSPIAVSRFLAATSSWRPGERDGQVSESWNSSRMPHKQRCTSCSPSPRATSTFGSGSSLRSGSSRPPATGPPASLWSKSPCRVLPLCTSETRSTRSRGSVGGGGRCARKMQTDLAAFAASDIDPRHPGKRYATDGNRAYCGQEHLPGRWHGYPVQWKEVPRAIWRQSLAENRVNKRSLKENW